MTPSKPSSEEPIDEMGDIGDVSEVKLPPQVKGKLEYHSTAAPRIEADKEVDEMLKGWWNGESYDVDRADIQALVDKACVAARIDEQIRTKISSVQRGEIMVHFPKEVISQRTRLSKLKAIMEIKEYE